MELKLSLFLLVLSVFATLTLASKDEEAFEFIKRSEFPDDFLFGGGSSAYQFEGAVNGANRGASIWDTFIKDYPDKITGRTNADIAEDQYHRYKEDVKIMNDIGFGAYRFSISWSRILPNGSLSGGINKEGVDYYNNLINELASKGMKSFVTLYHWDLPQALEDKYKGFLSHKLVKDYVDYVDLCFKLFGDRVKHWVTFNEPRIMCLQGYALGANAPGRCSEPSCTAGNSATEPYAACHTLLLSHAAAVQHYKSKYQGIQKGEIGITLNSNWMLPYSNHKLDIDAVQRSLDFEYGWFMDPLTEGKYPSIMRKLVGDRLPKFSKHQSKMMIGSYDFIGINYYTSDYVKNVRVSNVNPKNGTFLTDSYLTHTSVRYGVAIGPETDLSIFHVYPKGLKDLLVYTKNRYKNPAIYITENGIATGSNSSLSVKEILKDNLRTQFYQGHLLYLLKAIREGVNVRGFFGWSLLDDFEWGSGYTLRFGIVYVDFKDGLKRYQKDSAIWFNKFLKK